MTSSLFDLSGRVALVVGASRGIGRAIAQGLAEAGANVALASRTEADILQAADAIRALGVRAEAFTADVSRVLNVQALVRDVLVRMGQIDILVNVAGVNCRKPSTEIKPSVDIGLRRAASLLNTIEARARSSTLAVSPARWAFATSPPMRRASEACLE